MEEGFKIPFRCDALVDQKRYIGEDPVGYKCSREAKWEAPDGFLLCDGCLAMFKDPKQIYRLTFVPPYGAAYQKGVVDYVVGRFTDKNYAYLCELEREG